MRKITFAAVVSSALAALAIGLAGPALADDAAVRLRWRPAALSPFTR